jgi:hypothetical protein
MRRFEGGRRRDAVKARTRRSARTPADGHRCGPGGAGVHCASVAPEVLCVRLSAIDMRLATTDAASVPLYRDKVQPGLLGDSALGSDVSPPRRAVTFWPASSFAASPNRRMTSALAFATAAIPRASPTPAGSAASCLPGPSVPLLHRPLATPLPPDHSAEKHQRRLHY